MRIMLITDYNIPSGYQIIAEGLAFGLTNSGHEVKVLGARYDKRQVDYPFSVIPSEIPWLPEHITAVYKEFKPHWIVCMFDIPRLVALGKAMQKNRNDLWQTASKAAVFPVESNPLCQTWKQGLSSVYDVRFTFTEFGMQVLKDAAVTAVRLPVGLTSRWYADAAVQDLTDLPEDYVLTVASNIYRKNLPATLLVMNEFPELYHVIVTDPGSPDGWELQDLAQQYSQQPQKVIVIPRVETSFAKLRSLYRNAKALLHLPLAEGIGLPILEAQANGCPVVATDCTSITELLTLGALVETDNVTSYTWGNIHHYWASIEDAVDKLRGVLKWSDKSRKAVTYPTWQDAADKLAASLTVYEVAREASNVIKG